MSKRSDLLALAVLCTSFLISTPTSPAAEEEAVLKRPFHDRGFFVVSPLAGWNRNELKIPPHGPMPGMTLTDTEPEYGLFTMYAHPRFVVNNFFFVSEGNGADITGDVAWLNVYGRPEATCTWNVGAGYAWLELDMDGNEIDIGVPMVKAGMVVRCSKIHISLNPYLAYAWESVETAFGDEDSESILYGLTARWYWRMLHVTAKYYLQDDLDRNEQYNVVRVRASAFFSDHLGVLARLEYMEQETTDNTAFLLGPALVF